MVGDAGELAQRGVDVLGADANQSPLMAQVKTTEGWVDLILGMAYCESPTEPGGARQPDTELYKQAVTKFADALTIAQAANATEYINWGRAGRARANLLAGNYDAALADAQAVPAQYVRLGRYAEGVSTTFPGNQFHQNRNRSGGLRRIWWSMVDTSNNAVTPTPVQFVKDPWTQQNDPRMQVLHPRGRLGRTGEPAPAEPADNQRAGRRSDPRSPCRRRQPDQHQAPHRVTADSRTVGIRH